MNKGTTRPRDYGKTGQHDNHTTRQSLDTRTTGQCYNKTPDKHSTTQWDNEKTGQ